MKQQLNIVNKIKALRWQSPGIDSGAKRSFHTHRQPQLKQQDMTYIMT